MSCTGRFGYSKFQVRYSLSDGDVDNDMYMEINHKEPTEHFGSNVNLIMDKHSGLRTR